jgi:acetyl/propionyl-CoA carboxylase alpha subunit
VDSGIAQGSTVQGFYDPLAAKVVAHGRNREAAIARMRRALREFVIEGIATVLPLHRRILADEAFRSGDLSTSFLEDRAIPESLVREREEEVAALAAAIAARPALAAHLRPTLTLHSHAPSRWVAAGRPPPGR